MLAQDRTDTLKEIFANVLLNGKYTHELGITNFDIYTYAKIAQVTLDVEGSARQ